MIRFLSVLSFAVGVAMLVLAIVYSRVEPALAAGFAFTLGALEWMLADRTAN